jgi:hypothetical protein
MKLYKVEFSGHMFVMADGPVEAESKAIESPSDDINIEASEVTRRMFHQLRASRREVLGSKQTVGEIMEGMANNERQKD